jgi:hypothetical protein
MHHTSFRALSVLVALLLASMLGPAPAGAQGGTSPPEIVRALGNALDTIQARVSAGDQAGARAAYDAFENVWFSIEDTVRGLSGGSYRAIEDAMRTVRDAVYQGGADPARTGSALAALRNEINTFGAPYAASATPGSGAPVAGGGATGAGGAASAAPTSGPAASGPSTEECARYSGRAALPYFNYAQSLVNGLTLPGIPPAQAVTPQYAYGPGPAPGTVAMGPYRSIYPYPGRYGPGAIFGGVGATNPNPLLTTRGLTNAFLAGGQLTPLPNGTLGALTPDQIIALGANQASDVANQIALGDSQQSLVANQLGYSDLRYNWVQTYLQMSEQARDIALSLCGRIPG